MNYLIEIELPEGELKKTLDELHQAQETIQRCYFKLRDMEILHIKEEAISEN